MFWAHVRSRAVLRHIALAVAICFVLAGLGGSIARAAEDAKPAALDGKALIEALVNRNPKPEMVKVEGGPVLAALSPLYLPDYDWDEDHRVFRAFVKLVKSDSGEIWPQLVASIDDKRYAVAYLSDGHPYYMTVGDFCFWIARDDLRLGYIDAAPRWPGFGTVLPQLKLFREPDELVEWWRPRRDKPLCELQIEAAEVAISQVPNLDPELAPKNRTDQFIADVNERIAELRRTKRPLFRHRSPLVDVVDGFNAKQAETIRKLYEAQKDQEK